MQTEHVKLLEICSDSMPSYMGELSDSTIDQSIFIFIWLPVGMAMGGLGPESVSADLKIINQNKPKPR